MLTIWGRANSVNVQKVLWICSELSLPFERIDAGMEHGRTCAAEYLIKNPNGRVPTIEDGDFILWESNSIVRYLVLEYGAATSLYPNNPKCRARIDRWLDWTLSTLGPAERPLFVALVRTDPRLRDQYGIQSDIRTVAAHWAKLNDHLQDRIWVEGEDFSIADLVLGAYARRWFGLEDIERPTFPHLEMWYDKLSGRRGFKQHVARPLS